MKNYSVVTSFNLKYYQEIAKNNILFLDKFWPVTNSINLYHQLTEIDNCFSSRVQWVDLYKQCPELPEFAEKWKNHPKANGTHSTKPGMSFRWNAIKFCHKTFAIWNQAKIQKNGWLIWLDCDTIVKKEVNNSFLETICPDNYSISFMGRPGKYSECGFIGFNLDRPETRNFLLEWENLYLSGKFIDLEETHDSWTFDYLRLRSPEKWFFNVNSSAITNKNPFSQSLLGNYIAHAKGDSKQKTTKKIINRIN